MDRERQPGEGKQPSAPDLQRGKAAPAGIDAALQAIQRMAMEMDMEDAGQTIHRGDRACAACGSRNRPQNRFCSSCGVPLEAETRESAQSADPSQAAMAPGEHHYHHHYHHHYFNGTDGFSGSAENHSAAPSNRDATRTRAPLTGPSLSRAETSLRKTTQDWALACNTKQLDDLVSLYLTDAIVLRPNVPLVRGSAAIREFFFSVLESGLGEVELDPQRVEIIGEIGYEAGRCKMLVPSATGKRREERGKYLILYSRQGVEWRMVADVWCTDLSLAP